MYDGFDSSKGLKKAKVGDEIYFFVERNFNIGDRVRLWYNKRWYSGTVEEKLVRENQAPKILSRMDELVDSEPDALLSGYGLRGPSNNGRILFEDEPFSEHWHNSGEIIYHLITYVTPIKKKYTKEERAKLKQAYFQQIADFNKEADDLMAEESPEIQEEFKQLVATLKNTSSKYQSKKRRQTKISDEDLRTVDVNDPHYLPF